MSKYKVGDRVRVRKDLVVNKKYDGGCRFAEGMKEKIGCVGTIKEVRLSSDGWNVGDYAIGIFDDRYYVDFDGEHDVNFYNYSNSMLEPFEASMEKPKVEIYYYNEYNCPYYDLESLGVKSLIIAKPYVIVTNLVNDKQYISICHPNEKFDPYKGLEVCLSKRTIDELEVMLKDKEEEKERIEDRIKDIKCKIEGEKEYLRKM